jgi:signal peptidase I
MSKWFTKIGGLLLDLFETIVVGISIFLIVYFGFMQPHQVSGVSMVPNFDNGEYLLTDKVSYKLRSPQRGEVAVFHAPASANCPKGTGCDFIKRVIGVPGDTVEVRDGMIYLNGERLSEDYIPSDFTTKPGEYSTNRVISLGPDEYFVVGDNRSHSSDSRAWGPITSDLIVGRAFFSYWPIDNVRVIRTAQYPG